MRPTPSAPLDSGAITTVAAKLGVQLSESQSNALAKYARLLLRWNAVHNLTAIDSPADVLTHHLLDSLAIVPELRRIGADLSSRVLDVGAGGGLPGIPLAIAAPKLHVTLVDKVQKKVAFLTQAKLELALKNVDCVQTRVETLPPKPPFELIVARAFGSLAEFVRVSRHVLAEGGWWCAMKGALPGVELEELKCSMPDVRVAGVIRLQVPRLDAERHLIVMQVATPS